jgi:hypothetical protein
MMAISLWQPWASLWLSDRKVHETRHWECKWNGTLMRDTILVHAAKKFIRDVDGELEDILDSEFGHHWGIDLAAGALLGTVELIGCHRIGADPKAIAAHEDDLACGDWEEGRFAWRRGAYRVFKQPIPWKGAQGFFSVPDEIVRAAA